MHRQLGATLDHADDAIHARQIELRVDALAVDIHRHGNDIHVAGAFAIAEQGALDPIGTGHDAKFGGGNPATAIVVGVQADSDAVTTADAVANGFDLVGIDVGGRDFDSRRQVDDGLLLGRRLPDVDDQTSIA